MEKDRDLRSEISEKLNDQVLRGALGRFAEVYPAARAKAYENVPDVEALRDSVRQVKLDTVNNIEAVADRFEAEATKRGAKVFRAKDGAALKQYILDLCRRENVQRIVKSKSMASEEIHLNHDLEAAGIRVKETDLGEWIIALAGQKPSHMVMPAIHLNREQVANYFSKELQEDIPPDIPFMVQTARKTLREEFLQADMGISGANLAIAENGAVVLVTNEGNGRLTTTMPRIHVAIVGYEKLIPTIKDAAPILRTLPRNATAQLMTSYVSLISGPVPAMVKQNGEWVEQDKELHIILFDNGRLKAAKDEKFKQIYQCVRCASCLNVCPVYQLVGGHVYGHIYAGGIGAILTAFLHGMNQFEKFQELCIGCRTCTTVCPGKIDIPGLIEELRSRAVKEHGLPATLSFLFENVIANRKLFHGLLRAASIGQKPVQSGRFIRHLPLFLAGLTEDRSLPAVAAKPFRDRVAGLTGKLPAPRLKAAFFSGCAMDFVFPETGESVVKVLQDLNIEVIYPEDQACCGKPMVGFGDYETTKKVAKRNIEALESADADYVIVACPTCTETLHVTYPTLLAEEPAWAERSKKLAAKVREFTQFVSEEYKRAGREPAAANGVIVTYHDSCHMKRVLEIYQEPRELITAAGCELAEMKDSDKCCGMSGVFGLTHADLSRPILNQKLQNIEATGADVVAVACPGCMVQIQGGVDKRLPHMKVKHVADLLAEAIKQK